MTPEDMQHVQRIVASEFQKARSDRQSDLFNELQPIRLFLKRVDEDLYGKNGEPGLVKLIWRHDILLYVLIVLTLIALTGIFVLLLR